MTEQPFYLSAGKNQVKNWLSHWSSAIIESGSNCIWIHNFTGCACQTARVDKRIHTLAKHLTRWIVKNLMYEVDAVLLNSTCTWDPSQWPTGTDLEHSVPRKIDCPPRLSTFIYPLSRLSGKICLKNLNSDSFVMIYEVSFGLLAHPSPYINSLALDSVRYCTTKYWGYPW